MKTDVRQLTEESKQYQDDLCQIRASLSARISERDEEIEKLRKQLVLKQQRTSQPQHQQVSNLQDQTLLDQTGPTSGIINSNFLQASSSSGSSSPATARISSPLTSASIASTEEWEQRLKTLTENLIQKQSTVEQLSSTNHSLKLQLERSEQRFREMSSSGVSINNDGLFFKYYYYHSVIIFFVSKISKVAIGIYHSPTFTSYIKHRMHGNQSMDGSLVPLMEENPTDGHVTRKVKRAYGAIDAFR